ncbi:MAG: phage tail assembly chaperone [Hyphomicrobiaceae bacterium]
MHAALHEARICPTVFWHMTPRELLFVLGRLAPAQQACSSRAVLDDLMRRFPDAGGFEADNAPIGAARQ